MKPSSVEMANAAVITNQMAVCPDVAVLAEYFGVKTMEEAMGKCTFHGCSHFNWDIAGSFSAPGDALRLRLWRDRF